MAFQKHRVHLNDASGLSLHLNCNCYISECAGVKSHKCYFPWCACAAVPYLPVCVQATEITLLFACPLTAAQCFSRSTVKHVKSAGELRYVQASRVQFAFSSCPQNEVTEWEF